MNTNFNPGSAGRLTGFNKVPQASCLRFRLLISPQGAQGTQRKTFLTTKNTKSTKYKSTGNAIFIFFAIKLADDLITPTDVVIIIGNYRL